LKQHHFLGEWSELQQNAAIQHFMLTFLLTNDSAVGEQWRKWADCLLVYAVEIEPQNEQ